MKKILLILIILTFTFSGCQENADAKNKQEIELNLTTYINNDLASIVSLEKETITSFNNFESDETKSAEELIDFLENSIIPQYRTFLRDLSAINLENKEIQNAHNYYIESAKFQLDAFTFYLEGLKEFDYSKIEKVNSLISESRKYLSQYKNELRNIAERYEIKYSVIQ